MTTSTLQTFNNNEAALRAMHGDLTLVVKPKVMQTPRGAITYGGWAYLDGKPAVVPAGLDMLVLIWPDATGEVANMLRSPRAVLDILAPYVRRFAKPCDHFAITVPEDDCDALYERLEALPEHDPFEPARPAAAPARRVLYPMLKPPGYQYRDVIVHAPLLDRPDAPLVVFAEDTPRGYVFLTRENARGAEFRALFSEAAQNLSARSCDAVEVADGILATAGADFSADRLLDPNFLRVLHRELGADVWVGVPHRFALYALRGNASRAQIDGFTHLMQHELEHGPSKGHAPVSDLVFRVRGGTVSEAVHISKLAARLRS